MGKKQTFASDTSQRSITDWIRALLVLLLGLIIAHLGVTLFLLSALGTDTFTVFIQGLSRVAGLSVGSVYFDGSDVVNNQRICQTRNHCLCILRRPYH